MGRWRSGPSPHPEPRDEQETERCNECCEPATLPSLDQRISWVSVFPPNNQGKYVICHFSIAILLELWQHGAPHHSPESWAVIEWRYERGETQQDQAWVECDALSQLCNMGKIGHQAAGWVTNTVCVGPSTPSASPTMQRLFLLFRFSASSVLYSKARSLVCRVQRAEECSETVSFAWPTCCSISDTRDQSLLNTWWSRPTSSCTASISTVRVACQVAIADMMSPKPGWGETPNSSSLVSNAILTLHMAQYSTWVRGDRVSTSLVGQNFFPLSSGHSGWTASHQCKNQPSAGCGSAQKKDESSYSQIVSRALRGATFQVAILKMHPRTGLLHIYMPIAEW